jgi:hypothetical protein
MDSIESEIKEVGNDQNMKWYPDYLDLMEYKGNPNYGKSRCFRCLQVLIGMTPYSSGLID